MPDVQVNDCGSVVQLRPMTTAAKEWIEEYVQTESWQWMGDTLCVDSRFAGDLIDGMCGSGLSVNVG